MQSAELTLLQQVGARIQARREALKLQQARVAAAIGVQPETLSRLENGKQYVRMELLECLAQVLQVPLRELFPPETDSLYAQVCALLLHADDEMLNAIRVLVEAVLKVEGALDQNLTKQFTSP